MSEELNLEDVIKLGYQFKRAMLGLSPEEREAIWKMMDTHDERETTRITRDEIDDHSFERLISEAGGSEWQIMEKIAKMEDHYFKSLEGKNWDAMILTERAKTESPAMPSQTVTVGVPQVITGEQPKERKGLFRREKKE